MASSPTSSVCSSSSSAFSTTSKFASLPVMALRNKIVEKVQENRVTLIVGETGCGKSSQVPQFLLEEGMEPILCTQPRRFAVVAVARMVAKARRCEVGGEVGYHIGHKKVMSQGSRLVFKTAGVLLDEMRDKGVAALRYKVIILDEVHERSVESDLVLTCVKQFLLKNKDLRLVLMSATADTARYRDYFKDLNRDERVEVLAIPSSSQQTIFQRKVLYLEQAISSIYSLFTVSELLGIDSESLSSRYCSGTSPNSSDADIKPEVHKLIHDLVLHIHENEPDIEKSILVFLPTYYSLEQQWSLLRPFSSFFKVHILHSSIDTDQALMTMKIWKSHRKVILATNIAESSVTIPGVAFVIDSCRSLQVFWDNNRKKDSAELLWVSKSQADQRKGRTGRTCDGQIYRLVTRSFFHMFDDHERPSILRLSLRQQVLLVCCAESKAINDPKVLLQKALDPPDPEVVEDAISLLVQIHAIEKQTSHRGRYEPTFYGRLLACMTLSFDASVTILKFGDVGLLREGILIGILMDTNPLPILRPFGQDHLFAEYIGSYFEGNNEGGGVTGRKEVISMGNLCAYQFWQRVFKDKHRLERLKKLLKFNEPDTAEKLLPKLEEEWCSFHNLLQTSLHNVSEIYEDILNAMHRFRPKFLVTSNGRPSYYDPYEFSHTCFLGYRQNGDEDALSEEDDHIDPTVDTKTCLALPYVAPNDFKSILVSEKFSTVTKEIIVEHTQDCAENEHQSINDVGSHVTTEASLCRFFVKGLCNRGSQCYYSHSLQAQRPICKFFFSLQGCRNGASCYFSHDLGLPMSSISSPSFCMPEDEHPDAASFLQLLPSTPDGCILLLDDNDLHFSSHLSDHRVPAKIITTTSLPCTSTVDDSLDGVRVLRGLSHPYQTIISTAGENSIPWREVQCVLWFAKFPVDGNDVEGHRNLLRKFFGYLAIRILADSLYDLPVVLTMNNVRFSQLQVEKLARDSFFFLTESFPFDESSFGAFSDIVPMMKPMMVSRPVSYVFDLHPPTDIQFGNYAAMLRKCLYDKQ
ncbi:zinc finger protein [Macleaya cordata]|uniref:Zinc finger protein n=1 Tax=Macleaya cordata TaxID=56857 RepID=A0A200PPS7_MACCD|nr:zinc finger protein [Macleaya cordata]